MDKYHMLMFQKRRRAEMPVQHKGKLAHVLQAIIIIPMILFSIIITVLSSTLIFAAMKAEVRESLENTADNVELLLNTAYPGDYSLRGETDLHLYKGDVEITREYSLIDAVKEDCGMDVTVFYQDTRILTTIYNSSNARIVGSGAPERIITDVLKGGEAHFYPESYISGEKYFSYYKPLKNADGSIVGILFVGKPSERVNQTIQKSVLPLTFAVLGVVIVIVGGVFLYTRKFALVLHHICSFLNQVSTGNLEAELSAQVTGRNDEFGDIGCAVVSMQGSLRRMVETDALTGLFNRRSGERKLRAIMEKAIANQTPYCVSIGDIDFFKKVNDTYGHACGDEVLKTVAGILQEHMRSAGFVARWGGEEFLLVLDRMNLEQAKTCLEETLEHIRRTEILYENQVVKVTMTFGLIESCGHDYESLLIEADDKLYVGKSGGRNRVVA